MQNEIQDVDFKEVTNEQAAPATQKYRILHVQVAGNPTLDKLTEVATSVTASLNSDQNDAIVTTDIITTFVIQGEGDAPFTGTLVRGTLTVEDLARVLYSVDSVGEEVQPFNETTPELQQSYIDKVNAVLRHGGADGVMLSTVAALQALRPNLPAPSSVLKPVQTWTGNSNVQNPSAWVTQEFLTLKNTVVFRYEDAPLDYLCAVSDPYVKYQGPYAYYTIDAVPVHVTGIRQIDPEDVSKGVTLEWSIKQTKVAESQAQDGELTEAKAQEVQEQAATANEAGLLQAQADAGIEDSGSDNPDEPSGEAQVKEDGTF